MVATLTVEDVTDELVDFIRDTFNNNKEIFLHLLLCNSAYALDRLRYECGMNVPPLLCINVVPDKTNNTLTITDNGVGMTLPQLVDLASFSSSQASMFTQACRAAGADLNMIWQSGFGFYFAYLVADKVVVRTQHYNDEQFVWEYQAGVSSEVTMDTYDPTLVCGSRITLYLKRDQLEYLEDRRLRGLIMKYSSFISYPIIYRLPCKDEEEKKDEEVDKKMMKLNVY